MTDDTGLLQHSRFNVPDRAHGYCVDDNARALMLTAIAHDLPMDLRLRLASRYAAFLQDAWNETSRSFRNFMGYDRRWLECAGSQDSNGRTIWALAVAESQFPDTSVSQWAATLLDQVIGHFAMPNSPRTAAFLILAMDQVRRFRDNPGPAPDLLAECADYLLRSYQTHSSDRWGWFEPYLAYDNYRLSEAMICAGNALGKPEMAAAGLSSLRWLARRQTVADGIFRPVATEEFGISHAMPAIYDQQPIEAWAAIDAALAASLSDQDELWVSHAEAAFAWFTGANDARAVVANKDTGECCDGIGAGGINLNQGAESILAWQFAQRRITTLRSLDFS